MIRNPDAIVVVLVYNERLSESSFKRTSREVIMPRLHIALQEGFAGDPVSIAVDGREIYRKTEVRTRTQIGLADSVETTHDPGNATIDIRARDASATITPTVAGDLFLGISLAPDGHILHKSSAQPFRYM